MNKSKFACLSTLARFADAYMWTFTFAERLPISEAIRRWHDLQTDLTRVLGFRGVRVFELHPGGHGLHVHVVVPERFEVDDVRPIASACGFGRIHVEYTGNPGYVSKYVTKAGRKDWPKGTRLWASFGGIDRTRVRDVQVESLGNDIFQAVRDVVICPAGQPMRRLALLCYGAAEGYYICRASDKGGRWDVSFYRSADGVFVAGYSSKVYIGGRKDCPIVRREYDFV